MTYVLTKSYSSTWLALTFLSFATSACFVPKKTGVRMQADIDQLRQELIQAKRDLDEQKVLLEEQISRAKSQARAIADKIQDLNRAIKKSGADEFVQLEELKRKVQELTGTQELLTYELQQLGQKQAAIDEAVATPAEPPADQKELLKQGKELLKQQKYEDARGRFRQVVKKWPKEQGTADDALFQIGESYYRQEKYAAALQEYIKVVEQFAKGKFVDDAYYRIGICSMKLGNFEDAQVFFEEIVRNHASSPMVKYAKKKLAEVKQRLRKEKKKG